MAVESAADRLAFLGAADFGAEASYRTRGGTTAAVLGILDKPHINVAFGNADVADAKPTFFCRVADLPSDAVGGDVGDVLIIDGVAYQVAELQPDGTGMVLLVLGQ